MYVEHNFFIGLRDIDFNNNLKVKSLLSFLEDIGGIHSNKVGYGLLDIPEKKKSWMLLNWKVEFISKPHYGETLRIKTWTRKMDKLYAYRDFEIYNEKNDLVAIASSKWVCIDTEKMSITKINDDIKEAYTIEDKQVFEEEIEKIKEPKNYSSSCEIKITQDMIDVNGHVHNLNYIDFASQILPTNVMQNAKNIEILYKKQIKENDIVKSVFSKDKDMYYAVIKSQNDSIVHAIVKIIPSI